MQLRLGGWCAASVWTVLCVGGAGAWMHVMGSLQELNTMCWIVTVCVQCRSLET